MLLMASFALLLGAATNLPATAQTVGPNGRVAFSSDADGDWDIWTMNPDGTDMVNLTSADETGDGWTDTQPSWSPDGTRIAFTSTRGSGDMSDIYVMLADGTEITQVTTDSSPDLAPDWSPDGTRLVFWSERESESPGGTDDGDIYVVDVDGSNEQNITDDFENQPGQFQWADKDPDWSPVSNTIVFSSARIVEGAVEGAYWRIVTMQPDGSDQTVISDPNDPNNDPFEDDSPNFDEGPTWSPDGQWVAFSTHQQPEQQWDIQLVRANGTDQTNILPDQFLEELGPSWAPSGTEILFASNRAEDGTMGIYSIDVSEIVSPSESSKTSEPTVEPVGQVGTSVEPDFYGRLPCTKRGTPGPDEITGTDGRDVICARSGDDVIDAGRGRDVVYAGQGSDTAYGRVGTDLLFGGGGPDALYGGRGSDLCTDRFKTLRVSCNP
jgi:Tol biopolymer transport system component